ncbi:MAG: acyl-ACP--UDP-N-acetylglucosamine O-acyltransferase [Phycisphaerae bacterium]|nr:acyl-ACP--UDP-N-acetylglucosamine O-acyltransferase [Phycisphaerae bacterium]
MAIIHPTAVVEENARLADDVVVGPYCTIGGGVSIGAGTVLEARVIVTGNTTIGQRNHFYPNSMIGCNPQILGMGPGDEAGALVMGDRNVVRENVTIHVSKHAGTATRVGSDNLLMVGSHIGHDAIIEDKIVLSNLVQIGGHVKIETGAWFSGLAASHQFVTIGRWSYIAGLAGLTHDIPPYLMVSGHYPHRVRGVNKRGMNRAGLSEEQQERIFDAYRFLYRHGSTLLNNAKELAAQNGLDENVRAMVDAIFRSNEHRFGRYLESLRTE